VESPDLSLLPDKLPAAFGIRAPGACGARCTTTQQNAHSTEVVVCYAWHPWHGRTVRVERALCKRSQDLLQVAGDLPERTSLREIPAWMTNPVTCATMTAAERPMVTCETLRLLRGLIERHAVNHAEPMVKNQHSGFWSSRSKGDADVQDSSSPSTVSTRLVSSSSRAATVGD